MRITELLREELIKVNFDVEDKNQAISELVDLLVSEHEFKMHDRNVVLKSIMDREAIKGTGLEGGIAIPHGRVDFGEDLVMALGVIPSGIQYETYDGEKVRIMILLVIPQDKYKEYLKTLSVIANIFKEEQLRRNIHNAQNACEVMEYLEEAEAELYFSEM